MNKKKLRSTIIKYAACLIPAGLISWLVVDLHGYSAAATEAERYRVLCDAFTIPGVTLIMISLLLVISNAGGFDGIGYSMKRAIKMLLPFANKDMEKYYDYRERRQNNKLKGFGFIMKSGLIFLAIALFFMYKFYQVF